MALRDQPYLPLYIQDFLTDEKLMECSAAATGVYIRIMCMMHKSENYGKILLKQKDKQTPNQIKNFACKVAKAMPYDLLTIEDALNELVSEGVLLIESDFLVQKRMVKDFSISIERSKNGKKGGNKTKSKTQNFATDFAQAKVQANSEYENEYESEYDNDSSGKNIGEKKVEQFPDMAFVQAMELNEMEVERVGVYVKQPFTWLSLAEYWKSFSAKFDGSKFYQDRGQIISYFMNWLKGELSKKKTTQQTKTEKFEEWKKQMRQSA
jgi:hypothetical protein